MGKNKKNIKPPFALAPMCTAHIILSGAVLDVNDLAIQRLVNHFTGVITAIRSDTWRHYHVSWTSSSGPIRVAARSDLDSSKVLDRHPQPFWLEPVRLTAAVDSIRDKVADSFMSYDYDTITPQLRTVFGEEYIGEQTAGLDQLFPRRPPGRPPKRPREDDQEYKTQVTLPQNLRRRRSSRSIESRGPLEPISSDSSEIEQVSDIYLQASDVKSGRTFVFVKWLHRSTATWVPLASLVGGMVDWWSRERELVFPLTSLPELPIQTHSG